MKGGKKKANPECHIQRNYPFLTAKSITRAERNGVGSFLQIIYLPRENSVVPGVKVPGVKAWKHVRLPKGMTQAPKSSAHLSQPHTQPPAIYQNFSFSAPYRHIWSLEASAPGKQMTQSVPPCRHLPLQVWGQKAALRIQFFDGLKKVTEESVCQAFSCFKDRNDDFQVL